MRLRLLSIAAVVLAAGCSKKSVPAAQDAAPAAPATCAEHDTRGLRLVALSDLERTKMTATAMSGLVAVKHAPCGEITVLDRCTIAGRYTYEPRSPLVARRRFETAEELERDLVGAARLEHAAGTPNLVVETTIAGSSLGFPDEDVAKALEAPACAAATHVIVKVELGAIAIMREGEPAPFEASGERSGCGADHADARAAAPPECSAVVRVGLATRDEAKKLLTRAAMEKQAEAMQREMLGVLNDGGTSVGSFHRFDDGGRAPRP